MNIAPQIKELAKDCFGSRRIKIKNDKSFVDFFKLVAYMLQNEKVFISEKLFVEICSECQQKNGDIQLCKFQENNFLYQIQFIQDNSRHKKEDIKICLGVKGSKDDRKRFRLLKFCSSEGSFTSVIKSPMRGFYFDRPQTKVYENEK